MNTIANDIETKTGFVFIDDGVIVGYVCIIIGDEPAYHAIDGTRKTNLPYAVVHRIAFSESSRGKGLSRTAFSLIRIYCMQRDVHSIRVDTQAENKPMQHILKREGFEYCGLVTFDGGPKLAFELEW